MTAFIMIFDSLANFMALKYTIQVFSFDAVGTILTWYLTCELVKNKQNLWRKLSLTQ